MFDPATPGPVPVPPLVPFALILAGQPHAPVVYFARVSGGIKIGWTTNLAQRMRDLYVPVSGVLALVPGGQETESAVHALFAAWQIADGRDEVFDIEPHLSHLLADAGRLRWAKPPRGVLKPRAVRSAETAAITHEAVLALAARPGGVSSREAAGALTGGHATRQTAWRRLKECEAAGLAELRGARGTNRFYTTDAGLASLVRLTP